MPLGAAQFRRQPGGRTRRDASALRAGGEVERLIAARIDRGFGRRLVGGGRRRHRCARNRGSGRVGAAPIRADQVGAACRREGHRVLLVEIIEARLPQRILAGERIEVAELDRAHVHRRASAQRDGKRQQQARLEFRHGTTPRHATFTHCASTCRRYQPPGGLEVNCGGAMARQKAERRLTRDRCAGFSDEIMGRNGPECEEPGPLQGRVSGKQTRRSDYEQTRTKRTSPKRLMRFTM